MILNQEREKEKQRERDRVIARRERGCFLTLLLDNLIGEYM